MPTGKLLNRLEKLLQAAAKCVTIFNMGNGTFCNFFAKNGQRGFSMVASLVAAGMMGAMALMLAELTRQQQAVQKTTETYFEVNSLFNLIVRTLYDGNACNETLVIGQSINDGRNIDFIRNKNGGVVVNTTDLYGNRLLRIESMTLTNTRITGTSGEVDLKVVIKKMSKGVKGYDKASKTLPLSVQVASGGTNLIKCHHTTDNLSQILRAPMVAQATTLADTKVETARSRFCTDLGGTYSASAQVCSLPSSSPSSPPSSPNPTIPANLPSETEGAVVSRFFPPVSSDAYFCKNNLNNLYPSLCASGNGFPSIQQDTTNHICYYKTTSSVSQIFTSPISCADARVAATELVDPTDLASTPSTILPSGGYQGIVLCDCYILSESRYTARCRLFHRGYTLLCTYSW